MQDLVVTFQGAHLSIVGQGITSIPVELAKTYGEDAKELDLSDNCIQSVDNLDGFHSLVSLVLDHNELASKQEFPLMNSLNTLWVNNNKIESLEVFLECIKDKFPNLTYLSMLKNPCCPNYFIDASPITEQERKEGLALAKSMIRIDTTSKKEETEEENVVEDETITETNITEEPVTKTTFGVTKYVYFGRQSEGNRFIADHQL